MAPPNALMLPVQMNDHPATTLLDLGSTVTLACPAVMGEPSGRNTPIHRKWGVARPCWTQAQTPRPHTAQVRLARVPYKGSETPVEGTCCPDMGPAGLHGPGKRGHQCHIR